MEVQPARLAHLGEPGVKFDSKETTQLREDIFRRANEACENCLFRPAQEMDHFWGRREQQHSHNTWAICRVCHQEKTANHPTARHWVRRFMLHIARRMLAYPMLAPSWENQLDRCLSRLAVLRAKGMG